MNQETNETTDRFQAEFDALPLDKKLASLWKMETATLEEAVTYAVNSSAKAIDKLSEVFSVIGNKVEAEVKKAAADVADCKPKDPQYTAPVPPVKEPAAESPNARGSEAKKSGGKRPNP